MKIKAVTPSPLRTNAYITNKKITNKTENNYNNSEVLLSTYPSYGYNSIPNFGRNKYSFPEVDKAEFEKRKKELEADIEKLPEDIQKRYREIAIFEDNILFVQHLVKSKKFNSNPYFLRELLSIADPRFIDDYCFIKNTKQLFECRANMLDTIFEDPKYYGNANFWENCFPRFIDNITDKDSYNNILRLSEVILSNKVLYDNKNINKHFSSIFYKAAFHNYSQGFKKVAEVLDKYHDENESNPIEENLGRILKAQMETESLDELSQLLDTILSDTSLSKDKKFMNNIADTLKTYKYKKHLRSLNSFTKFILNTPVLREENSIQTMLGEIIGNFDSEEDSDAALDFAKRVAQDKRLYTNSYFMSDLGGILYSSTKDINQCRIKALNKIFGNKKYYENPHVINNLGSLIINLFTKTGFEVLDKALKCDGLLKTDSSVAYIASALQYPTKGQVIILDEYTNNEDLNKNDNITESIGKILYYTFEEEDAQAKLDVLKHILSNKNLSENKVFMNDISALIISITDNNVKEKAISLLNNPVIAPQQVSLIINPSDKENYSQEEIINFNEKIGLDNAKKLNTNQTKLLINFVKLMNVSSLDELPTYLKNELLTSFSGIDVTSLNIPPEIKELFPLIPSSEEEYCNFLPQIINSLCDKDDILSPEQINSFNSNLFTLGEDLASMTDESFNKTNISLIYPGEKFINDINECLEGLSEEEQGKIFACFDFKINNSKNKSSVTGYPNNKYISKRASSITNPETKEALKRVNECVVNYTTNNRITCENKTLETELNHILGTFPEIASMIGKSQHDTHDFDLMKHSLKVMYKIVQNSDYNKLNASDKKLMLIAALFHDIAKKEGEIDNTHAKKSAFEAFIITHKLDLSRQEKSKLNSLISMHEWLKEMNTAENIYQQSSKTAYALHYDNLFDMSQIFTIADLKAVKEDDSFFEQYENSFNLHSEKIRKDVKSCKCRQPMLPTTKFPSAQTIDNKITCVNSDGSTNIKGVYKDKDGLVVLKYNEIEDWEEIGFPKGSKSRGIKFTNNDGKEVDTGNIKFLVHGLDYPNQLSKIDLFSHVDSDTLLSVSYADCPESEYRFYANQGLILYSDTNNIHAGGALDSGTGRKKTLNDLKEDMEGLENYCFVSSTIKNALNLSNEEYIDFIEQYKDKSIMDIEPATRDKLIIALTSCKKNIKKYERLYNEFLITNPNPPMAVFAYNPDFTQKIGKPLHFLHKKDLSALEYEILTQLGIKNPKSTEERTGFLREYAIKNNIPCVVFGD
ncbi:hypothetical protein II906_08650 [bacterium]|nr:hypothetical protein [bacterium]